MNSISADPTAPKAENQQQSEHQNAEQAVDEWIRALVLSVGGSAVCSADSPIIISPLSSRTLKAEGTPLYFNLFQQLISDGPIPNREYFIGVWSQRSYNQENITLLGITIIEEINQLQIYSAFKNFFRLYSNNYSTIVTNDTP